MDAHVNFGYSTVATAPSPATSGVSLVVASGEGADFPATPFNAVVWPAGANPRKSTAEVVRVTNISTDTFTITRAQESSPARTIVVGDQIADAVTAKTLTDIEGNVDSVAPVTQAFGDAAASGSSAIFARRDHKHGMPSIPIGSSQLVYRYTVTGSDKASIDTGADTADAGSNDWTDGDVLEVWIISRTDDAAATALLDLFVNNDTGTTYDSQKVTGANATPSASTNVTRAGWLIRAHGSGGTASYPSVSAITFPGYAGTVFNKTGTNVNSTPDNTAANEVMDVWSYGWRNAAAITRMKVAAQGGAKLKVGSQLLIYKRKAS